MEGEAVRLVMQELEELLCSSISASAQAELLSDRSFEPAGQFGTNYREKLRSYSSFPAAASTSDTTSQCTGAEMDVDVDVRYAQSLSDGDGVDGGHRRRVRSQVRQRCGSQFKGKSRADPEMLETTRPSRRSYECDVCGHHFPSPQSLGGHKNLHKNKGRTSASRRRYRAPPVDQMVRGQGSESNSSESDGVPPVVYKGVRCREGDKWVTEIRPPKSADKWWLGTFSSAEEAAQAYDVALAFFKSESELNFGHHALYGELSPISPDLSPHNYAQRLREMVKDVSEKIIAERRRESTRTSPAPSTEDQGAGSSSHAHDARPAVSADTSSSARPTEVDLPVVGSVVNPDPPPFDPLSFLNFYGQ